MKELTCLLILLTSVTMATSANAEVVALIHATSASSNRAAASRSSLSHVLDGSGLSDPATPSNYDMVTHSIGFNAADQFLANETTAEYTFVFSAPVDINRMLIWNYTQSGRDTRAVKDFAIQVDLGSGFGADIATGSLAIPDCSNHVAEILSFTQQTGVQQLRFQALSNWGWNDGTGLDEVLFAQATVPEPRAFLLGVTGLLGLLAFARREGRIIRHARRWICCPLAGFTLVELLAVITIIGLLIALLLPAVQAAREAARRSQCQNHLKQLALASLEHELALGRFPCGGWGLFWVGDPDRGFGLDQPGGWTFNILPFIEQQTLHDLGSDGQPDTLTPQQKAGAAKCITTPVAGFYCPSRRRSIVTPLSYFGGSYTFFGADPVTASARTDYAVCAGDQPYAWVTVTDQGPSSFETAKSWTEANSWPSTAEYTGIAFLRSQVTMAMVRDGVSNTFLVGEKALNPDHYITGRDGGDNETAFSPNDNDTQRTTYYNLKTKTGWLPEQDTLGHINGYGFGSAHPGSCNFAVCDGSVRSISYTIDGETDRRLGNRHDGLVVDQSVF